MLRRQILLSILLSTGLFACNVSTEESIFTTPTQWRFDSYFCAVECDTMLNEVLNSKIGDVLDFKSPRTGFDLFSECGGKLSLKQTRLSREELIEQLNETVPPNQRFSENNTGLTDSTLNTAQAICHENGKDSSTFWVVSLTDETMTVYFEGSSFLNFKTIDSN